MKKENFFPPLSHFLENKYRKLQEWELTRNLSNNHKRNWIRKNFEAGWSELSWPGRALPIFA